MTSSGRLEDLMTGEHTMNAKGQTGAAHVALWVILISVTGFVGKMWAAEARARAKPGADQVAWAKIDAGRSAKSTSEAEALFRAAEEQAKDTGDTWAQGAAVNGRALLVAGRGRTEEAIALLAPLPLVGDDPEAFIYQYNLGRVLEQREDRSRALKAYEASLWYQPDYDAARDRLYNLFLRGEPDIPRALWTGDLLIQHGQATLVATRLLDLLDKWGADSKAPALFVQLARVYGAGGWDAKRFGATDEPRVRRVGEEHPGLKSLADQLIDAFEAQEPAGMPGWQMVEGGKAAMSRLLLSLAGGFLSADPPQVTAAAARSEAAWRIDPENTDAPVVYASVLARYSKEADPTGTKLRNFVEELMEAKGQLYALPTRTRADWLNLLRLHTILGGIFDEKPSLSAQRTIYTSVYHWTRATEIQEMIRKNVDPSFPLSPRLYVRLAEAQRRDESMAPDAWNSYVQAATVCDIKDKSLGLAALKSAQDVATKLELTPGQILKFNQVSSQVQNLKGLEMRGAATLPAGVRWLPAEYRAGNLSPEQTQKLGEANEKYEKRMNEAPLKRADIEKERTRELDSLLDPAQQEQVNNARANRRAEGR